MADVEHLTKRLTDTPEIAIPREFAVRTYAGPEDIEGWLRLREAAFARQRIGVRAWAEADFAAEFLDRWWWQREQMWLAESAVPSPNDPSEMSAPTLVGAVTLAFRGTSADAKPVVHWLMVHPAWRRRGIGRTLMAHLEACARQLGHRQVWLETHAQWREAAALYRALGYVVAD